MKPWVRDYLCTVQGGLYTYSTPLYTYSSTQRTYATYSTAKPSFCTTSTPFSSSQSKLRIFNLTFAQFSWYGSSCEGPGQLMAGNSENTQSEGQISGPVWGFNTHKGGWGMSSPTHTPYTPSFTLPAWQLPTRRQKLPI